MRWNVRFLLTPESAKDLGGVESWHGREVMLTADPQHQAQTLDNSSEEDGMLQYRALFPRASART